jgi:hypothetical protein
VFRTSLLRISPIALLFIVFFLYVSFVFIASVLLVSGNLVSYSSPGNTLRRSFTLNSLSSLDFSFIYHNTTWLDPGAGIWMHLQLGRDSIQAACFLLAFFLPSSLVLKKKTYTQQCTTLGSSPRQKFSTDSSMISPELSLSFFSSFLFTCSA